MECKACKRERHSVLLREDGICERCHELGCLFCGRLRGRKKRYCCMTCQIKAQCDGTDNPDGCWPWRGAVKPNGYGTVHVKVRGVYTMRAPARVMFSIEHGEVPRTTSVVQKCGTKNCCNPKHLKLVVQELRLSGDDIEEIAC